MHLPLAILSVLVMVGTAGVFLYDLKTRRYDLLSFRNIFLLGFVHFLGLGAFFTAVNRTGSTLYVPGDRGFSLFFTGMLVFIPVFYLSQRVGSRWGGLRRVVPPLELPVTKLSISASIMALLGVAMVAAVIPIGGFGGAIVAQFRSGPAAAAVALATYNLLARKFNPVAWAVFFGTLGCAALLSTVGEIGRRGLLGTFLAIGWIWFYFSLRYRSSGSAMFKLGVLLTIGVFALLVYAGFRSRDAASGRAFSLNTRIQQFSEAVKNPTVASHSIENVLRTDTSTISMFIMENYPDTFDYDPFHGLIYIVTNPIPRRFWPEKPVGLGMIAQEQLRSPANLGPGILGHGWAEGGFIGIAGYALFFGLFTAAVDNLIRQRAWNPFFLAAIGSSLGNVCGLARGETSLFLLQVLLSYFGVMVTLYILKILFGPIFASSAPLLTDVAREYFMTQPDTGVEPDPDDPSADQYANYYAATPYPEGATP